MPFSFPDNPAGTVEELRSDLKNSLFPVINRRTITATIGTASTPVAHGLGEVPTVAIPVPRADARVWRSAAHDKDHVFFAASTSVVVDIEVSRA